MDTQIVELLGQHHLVDQMLRAGVEIAVPVRDHGVDLIAYVDRDEFRATPIQVKVSSKRGFAIDRKYENVPDLLLVYVWNVESEEDVEMYALGFGEAHTIAVHLEWTATESWANGKYVTSRPSKKLIEMLQEHRVSPGQWKARLEARDRLSPSR